MKYFFETLVILYIIMAFLTHGYAASVGRANCGPEVPYQYADSESMIYRNCLIEFNNPFLSVFWPIYWGTALGERVFK